MTDQPSTARPNIVRSPHPPPSDDASGVGERPGPTTSADRFERVMGEAIAAAASVRRSTSPNPWVGAALMSATGEVLSLGATEAPGGRHAEIVAIDAAGANARGATLVVTLEPCSHHGRTPPCTDAIVAAGIARVVVGVQDPDDRVSGRGIAALRTAGLEVIEGISVAAVTDQLRPYLHHRRTGRPFVVAKIAATLDGATGAPDGTSQWITGPEARRDVHRIRAESDAILIGAATVRTDDPALTVRHVEGRDPLRVVLGNAPPGARVHPCVEWVGPIDELLDELGGRGVVQLMLEGGPSVIRSFHDAGLIDRWIVYLAPALFGGRDALPMLAGASAPTMADLWRGRFVGAERVGVDLRIELAPLGVPLRSDNEGDH